MVRVTDLTYTLIAQSLDGGAQGLVFPRIYTADQVREVVRMARYPPVGVRGNAQWRAYTGWTGGSVSAAMAKHNQQTLLLFQIETQESIDNLDAILSVDGCDGVLVGPNDLSINLGTPDDWHSEAMTSAMKLVVDRCMHHGVIPGIHISDTAQTVDYYHRGYRLLSANSEMGFLQQAATAHVNNVRTALGSGNVMPKSGQVGSGGGY